MLKNVENLPRFMQHLEPVTTVGENRTRRHPRRRGRRNHRRRTRAPARLAVRLRQRRQHRHADLRPRPGGRGTLLSVALRYSPPGGIAGAVGARIFGEEPSLQIAEGLRRFKRLIETGEIPTTLGQPSRPPALQPSSPRRDHTPAVVNVFTISPGRSNALCPLRRSASLQSVAGSTDPSSFCALHPLLK